METGYVVFSTTIKPNFCFTNVRRGFGAEIFFERKALKNGVRDEVFSNFINPGNLDVRKFVYDPIFQEQQQSDRRKDQARMLGVIWSSE